MTNEIATLLLVLGIVLFLLLFVALPIIVVKKAIPRMKEKQIKNTAEYLVRLDKEIEKQKTNKKQIK